MRIDLYATCWNDARMLGFFFRHYDPWVQRYIIFDDGSSDASVEILRAHPKVEVRRWLRHDPDSFVLSEQHLSNHCWKESRGRADWVMVLDLDEFLFQPSLPEYLSLLKSAGVTVVPALGFQMMTETFPEPDEELAKTCGRGAPWMQMCKCSLFDPAQIDEINFLPGRHQAEPTGRVVLPERDELLNLHYKYLGFDYVVARHRELHGGLGVIDHSKNWGHKYAWSTEELRNDWEQTRLKLIDVTADPAAAAEHYPLSPWWRGR